jgi:hypothetical protein
LKTRRKKGNENRGQSLDIGRWNWGEKEKKGRGGRRIREEFE